MTTLDMRHLVRQKYARTWKLAPKWKDPEWMNSDWPGTVVLHKYLTWSTFESTFYTAWSTCIQ